jgi:phage-related holin
MQPVLLKPIPMSHMMFLLKLFDFSQFKVQAAAFYAGLFSMILTDLTKFSETWLGISVSLFLVLFLVMITDYITGLRASKKEGQKFISKKGLGWVFKFGSYLVFLMVSFSLRKELLEYGFDWLETPFKLIHFYILIHIFYWELKSVDENFERLNYSIRILKITDDIYDMFKGLVKRKIDAE